jgi:SPASM domain peptide maturase of grasp-with-spasm system
MKKRDNIFMLYANCIQVKGARRSSICDLQNRRVQLIPNDLFDILTKFKGLPTPEIKRHFTPQNGEIIDEYFDLLVEQGYGSWFEDPELFPEMDLSWRRPETITNAIIDVTHRSSHDYQDIFSQLEALGCQAAQVRAYDPLSFEQLEVILLAAEGGRLRHLDLIIGFQAELTADSLTDFCLRHQVVSWVIVHSSPRQSRSLAGLLPTPIIFDTYSVTQNSCGEVSPGYFSPCLQHFTEALQFNTCLNGKISVDADGEIRHCPSMRYSLGNIRNTRLAGAVNDPRLAQMSRITKDQVEVCRDCEFRYVCTDCRAYTRESGNPYSKPAKCSYDPYTATWEKPGSLGEEAASA